MFNLIGKTLGPYRILEQIGVGGMATVYKAYQPSMDRYVAIKVLPPYLSQDDQFARRFQREAHAIARLEHAHILPVYDYGESEGVTYIVMRYIAAGTLKEYIAKKSLPYDEIARLIGQVASALDYAHRLGIIHRDVKPNNILIDEQANTYLTDFGLARMIETTQQITGSGVGIGTPNYMSPEQGKGIKADHRSDIYSLGVILYEMATGRVPFEAETPMAVVLKHITDPLPLPRSVAPDVPEAVEMVILKALAKEPAHRYQSAGELSQALTAAVRKSSSADVTRISATKYAPEPQSKVANQVSILTRVGQLWQKPVGKLTLLGGGLLGMIVLGFLLSLFPGRIAVVGSGNAPAATATPAMAATNPLPTRLEPTATPPATSTATPRPPTATSTPKIPLENQGRRLTLCMDDVCIVYDDDTVVPLGLAPAYENFHRFSWSPDGKQVVLEACLPGLVRGQCSDLYIKNLETGELSMLPREPGRYNNPLVPSWSPNGELIAFHDAGGLSVIRPDGSQRWELLRNNYCPTYIAWAPDSRQIAYLAHACNQNDQDLKTYLLVTSLNLDHAHLLWVSEANPFDSEVAFSPDGSFLVVRFNDGSAYQVDPNCNPGPVGCSENTRSPLNIFPEHWLHTYHPQWGNEALVRTPTP